MNNTDSEKPYVNTTVTYSLEYYYALFINPILVVRLYQIAYPITFVFGFLGNLASLITFSRPALRKVSTSCLFIMLAISDTLYLLICIFDFIEFGMQIRFYGHVKYNELCRFRSFVMYVSQVLSSWILVTISVDRWIRTRFPYSSKSLCTPKNALIIVGILVIIDAGIHAHILTPLYGMLIPGFTILACGPTIYSGSYFIFYFLDWSQVQIVIICLLPVSITVLCLIDTFSKIRLRKRAVIHTTHIFRRNNRTYYQKNLQMHMFILTTTSICVFLLTTLPVAIYRITSPRQKNISTEFLTIITIWASLTWLQSLNYALNFYSHCLTSNLFRKEFKQQITSLCTKQSLETRVHKFPTPEPPIVLQQQKY